MMMTTTVDGRVEYHIEIIMASIVVFLDVLDYFDSISVSQEDNMKSLNFLFLICIGQSHKFSIVMLMHYSMSTNPPAPSVPL